MQPDARVVVRIRAHEVDGRDASGIQGVGVQARCRLFYDIAVSVGLPHMSCRIVNSHLDF